MTESVVGFGWLGKAIIAMICIMPFMLVMSFFNKNFGIRTEIVILVWQSGTIIGMIFWGLRSSLFASQSVQLVTPLLAVFVMAVTIGTMGNILLSQSVALSPNPALPFSIINAGSAFVYVLAIFLAWALPKYFEVEVFSWSQMSGITMVIVGLGLIMYKN